jgi:membrane-bound serine protease (ClpP class)
MDQMETMWGFLLIAVGFLLLAAELFIPTSGTLFVLAIASIGIGVAMTFYYDSSTGFYTLVGVAVALPIFGSLLLHYWPKTRMGRRFFLSATGDDETVASMPVHLELEELRGRFGKAVSALRPSGITDFDGRRVDTITEGIMVDPGQWVRCVDVRAGKVIVRPVEKPNLGDLETADFR